MRGGNGLGVELLAEEGENAECRLGAALKRAVVKRLSEELDKEEESALDFCTGVNRGIIVVVEEGSGIGRGVTTVTDAARSLAAVDKNISFEGALTANVLCRGLVELDDDEEDEDELVVDAGIPTLEMPEDIQTPN